jgi:hypothetical protein
MRYAVFLYLFAFESGIFALFDAIFEVFYRSERVFRNFRSRLRLRMSVLGICTF